jgi:hypothetical protein
MSMDRTNAERQRRYIARLKERAAAMERLGFVTRIRRIRRIMTPLGFTTRQITNAYRVHEPTSGLGLIAKALFATESNSWTPSETNFSSKRASDDFERANDAAWREPMPNLAGAAICPGGRSR